MRPDRRERLRQAREHCRYGCTLAEQTARRAAVDYGRRRRFCELRCAGDAVMRRRHEDGENAGPARGDHISPCISYENGAVAVGISQGKIQKVWRRFERRSVKASRDEYVVNRDLSPQRRVQTFKRRRRQQTFAPGVLIRDHHTRVPVLF